MKLRLFAFAAATAFVTACVEGSTAPLALGISLTASATTAAVGDTINFVATTQGTNMIAIDADYGDGATEHYDLPLARTARNTFAHAYASAGSYTARFVVTQFDTTSKVATASIQVH